MTNLWENTEDNSSGDDFKTLVNPGSFSLTVSVGLYEAG